MQGRLVLLDGFFYLWSVFAEVGVTKYQVIKMNSEKKPEEEFLDDSESVKKNEEKAEELVKEGKVKVAIKLLKENLKMCTSSSLTYDLLFYVYSRENNYSKVIKLLNMAIKYCNNKQKYRKLKKDFITRKIMDDIERIKDTKN
jgi:predicted Zn-dependent protease